MPNGEATIIPSGPSLAPKLPLPSSQVMNSAPPCWYADDAKIDYKNPQILRSFVTDRGKMIPRRISGASARQQRVISTALRRARMLALLPFSVTGD